MICTPEQLMKNDLVNRTRVAAPAISRRNFIGAAAATGVAAIVPAGLESLRAEGIAMTAAQFVLPAATTAVTPFKIHVPQSALDDLKKRLANARWPDKEPVTGWSQGVPLEKIRVLADYWARSEEHTSELQSHLNLVCRLLLEKKQRSRSCLFLVAKKRRTRE